MSAKILSFKILPKADATYLEFQKHTNRYSNTQSTVHITTDSYCSPLPHKTQPLCCAFVEHRAVKSCVAWILQTTLHGTTWPRFHLHILEGFAADFLPQITCISVVCFLSFKTAGNILLVSRAARNNHISVFFVYNLCWMYGVQFTPSVFAKYITHTFTRGIHFLN